jgi:nicotinamide mononucleotide transporter
MQQSIVEIFAVILSVCYVWLATQESVWCWPAGFLSTALFVYVYWDVTLIFQMLLNVYYMAVAVWGFISWRKQGVNKLSISRMRLLEHVYILSLGAIGTVLVYLIARQWFTYDLVLLDIGVTVFALFATYLTLVKKLDNWAYWIIINTASVLLLVEKELYLTIVLTLVYIILAARGLVYWYTIYKRENTYEF